MAKLGYRLIFGCLVAAAVVIHLCVSVFTSYRSRTILTQPDEAVAAVVEEEVLLMDEPAPEVPEESWEQPELRNATFVMLSRNEDIDGVIATIDSVEHRFNNRYGYPYVFLNDVEFSEEFKARVKDAVSPLSTIEFGLIPTEDWSLPEWIDKVESDKTLESMGNAGVIYGGSLSYRHMCRFYSGLFYKHPLMLKYRWYWRLEPQVTFHCNIWNDPFRIMELQQKSYGFTISTYEVKETIVSLWDEVKEFMNQYPQHINDDNALRFLSNTNGRTYNRCHFWSNFEVADMDFWRGEAYTDFFNFLDRAGGIYYERWGDAPIHSIAASLLLPRSKIHFFDDIGYQHNDWTHCPTTKEFHKQGQCDCDPSWSFDNSYGSCLKTWDRVLRI